MLQEYLPGLHPSKWTMKKFFLAIVNKHGITHRINDNARQLAANIDWWVANPGGVQDDMTAKKQRRWSPQLDLGRLLMIMLGDQQARAAYLQSIQLPDRQRLDDTTLKSLKVEYWLRVSEKYNDPERVADIDVGHAMANLYLKGVPMKTEYRVTWPVNILCEKFRKARAAYEKSDDYDRYIRSGQNSDKYYPDFNHSNNPSFVMMHYLFRELPKGSVMGDLPDDARIETTNAPIEHHPSDGDDTDVSEYDEEGTQEQTEAPPHAPTSFKPPAAQRALYDSPASSIASSASRGRSRSRGRGRGRHGRSTDPFRDAGKSLKNACDQILASFNRMQEDNRRQQVRRQQNESSNDCDVTRDANKAMQLIQTKRKIVAELTLLRGTDGDFGVEVKLLEKQLLRLTAEIQKHVSV